LTVGDVFGTLETGESPDAPTTRLGELCFYIIWLFTYLFAFICIKLFCCIILLIACPPRLCDGCQLAILLAWIQSWWPCIL